MYSQKLTKEELTNIIIKARKMFNLPAISVSIISTDDIISVLNGKRVYNQSNKVQKDDLFHIGSCSKSVLAMLAAKLVEDEKIRWDSKYFDLYPELISHSMNEYHTITLLDLFLCQAGILPFTDDRELTDQVKNKAKNSRVEFAKWLFNQKPVGDQNHNGKYPHVYSNASYTLASLMLEKASGQTYEELVQKFLNNELDLNVHIGFPNKVKTDQPWGHLINGDSIETFNPDHEYVVPALIRPAGDLSMTSNSFARYLQIILNGLKGHNNFLKSESWTYICFSNKGFSIGLGNGKMAAKNFVGMDGSTGTFYCRGIIVPESNFAFSIMTNAGSGTGEMKVIDWITQKIIKKHYNWWWKFWM